MQTLPPTYINRRQIRELFEETYTFRQQQQKLQLSTPTQLFAEYPRMLDTDNGVLVYAFNPFVSITHFFTKYMRLDIGRFSEKVSASKRSIFQLHGKIPC